MSNLHQYEDDDSWVEKERRLMIHDNIIKEPMTDISVFYIYINLNDSIDKITSDRIELSVFDNGNGFKKEQLMYLIQSHKLSTPSSRFRLTDILLFNMDIDPENISSLQNDDDRFFHVVPIVNDIIIPPSVFIFHDINCFYFIYREYSLGKDGDVKSILKGSVGGGKKRRITKKVSLQVPCVSTNGTRKVYSDFHDDDDDKETTK